MPSLLLAEQVDTRVRNFRPGDEAAILEISAAADEVDRVERRMTIEELEEWLNVPGVQPRQDFFLAEVEGRPIGYAGFDVLTGSLERHVAFCGGEVHPDFRRRGVGAALMQAIEARAGEVLRAQPAGLERHLESYCRSTQADVAALYRSRAMAPVRYFFSMQHRLDGALPEPATPDGFAIRTYRDEDDDLLRAAFDDAFRDHWGFEPISQADWQHFFRGTPYFRPELWLLAWAGDELAGFTLNFVEPGYMAQVGRPEGKVADVGVRRAWRRRGLATALLGHSLLALKRAGMESAALGVDADSPTNAVRLYERVGFKTIRQNVVYRKTL